MELYDFNLFTLILLSATGVLAGFLNVIAGGGSLITLPLMIFFGLPPALANGTNRIAIILQNISAITSFHKHGIKDIKQCIYYGLAALPGGVLGAIFANKVEAKYFNYTLAGVMIMCLFFILLGNQINRLKFQLSSIWIYLLLFGIGFYGGFIQAGVGFLMMMVLFNFAGINLVRVNLYKVFIVNMFNIPSLFIFWYLGNVNFIIGLALAVGNMIGARIAVYSSIKKGEKFIKFFLVFAIVAFSVKLIFFS